MDCFADSFFASLPVRPIHEFLVKRVALTFIISHPGSRASFLATDLLMEVRKKFHPKTCSGGPRVSSDSSACTIAKRLDIRFCRMLGSASVVAACIPILSVSCGRNE